ncbi:carbohydrate ABC transporter permease [Paenibacillus koleovorans]|uniref:carbohydrate ABC transporter permease n=1 Tax=Paenibacillus koleovorans TaxID=121608 RepID=UPI000FD7B831|nr:carbohydrate ABC transporter permease [Paenibacillus koleovorans]
MVRYSRSFSSRFVTLLLYFLLGVLGALCLLPFWYILSVSLTPYTEVLKHGGFLLFPRQLTWQAYHEVLFESALPHAFRNTLFITLAGTALSLAFTIMGAFALAKKELPLRRAFMLIIVFTMLFNGGIIPTYLIVKQTGLLDSLWSLIIPVLVSPFNLFIVKAFFEQMPEELEDASIMDGVGEAGYLTRIVLPLSLPVIATISLFYAVGYWNSYFHAILYLNQSDLYPLQVVLRQMIATPDPMHASDMESVIPPETMKMAAVVIATLPILAVYPMLQKYFVKGATLGAIKG